MSFAMMADGLFQVRSEMRRNVYGYQNVVGLLSVLDERNLKGIPKDRRVNVITVNEADCDLREVNSSHLSTKERKISQA